MRRSAQARHAQEVSSAIFHLFTRRRILVACLFFAGLTGYSFRAAAAGTETVGLQMNMPGAWPGYTLFASINSTNVYLIDMEGQVVHRWRSPYQPGLVNYIRENGNLVSYHYRFLPSWGVNEGVISEFDWDGNLLWEYAYSDTQVHAHHDIVLLPNGNILMVAHERKSNAEAIAAGRTTSHFGEVWPLHVVEIEPVGTNRANIVWVWRIWDHLIQDFNSNQANFGVVGDHPELVDINYGTLSVGDWLHTNAIDYNEALDQIILSVISFSEVWVIDHSTTTAEAAGHTGGSRGKGGDLLYRWGNPSAYDRGNGSNRTLWRQHDARWIRAGLPGAGNMTVFNNGVGRPGGSYSTIEEFTPPVDASGFYTNPPAGMAFGPSTSAWVYTASPPSSLYSFSWSGANRHPNGNTLICEGVPGDFQEVTASGELVWRYINPVNAAGPITQGVSPTGNGVYRADRYPLDYPGFTGRDLTPKGTVELDGSAVFAVQQIERSDTAALLTWTSIPEATYLVQHTPSLTNPVWSTIATNVAMGTLVHYSDTDESRINQIPSFYQVVELP